MRSNWVLAVAGAAAHGHAALAHLLLSLPTAPGQPRGARSLTSERQALLLTSLVANLAAVQPPLLPGQLPALTPDHDGDDDEGAAAREERAWRRRVAAAVDLLLPLCLLPGRGPPRPRWPWEADAPLPPEVLRARADRRSATRAAAALALQRGGVRGVLTALQRHGMDDERSAGATSQSLVHRYRCSDGDAGHVLLELVSPRSVTGGGLSLASTCVCVCRPRVFSSEGERSCGRCGLGGAAPSHLVACGGLVCGVRSSCCRCTTPSSRPSACTTAGSRRCTPLRATPCCAAPLARCARW